MIREDQDATGAAMNGTTFDGTMPDDRYRHRDWCPFCDHLHTAGTPCPKPWPPLPVPRDLDTQILLWKVLSSL